MDLIKIDQRFYSEIFQWRNDPYAREHNPFAPCEFDEFTTRMNSYSPDIQNIYAKKDMKWGYFNGEEILGIIGITKINQMMKTAELTYQVSPLKRNQGHGFDMAKALISKLFSQTDLRKLIALISDNNIPSYKIVEKLGFQKEGLLRSHFLIEGEEVDERIYGLLKKDFIPTLS